MKTFLLVLLWTSSVAVECFVCLRSRFLSTKDFKPTLAKLSNGINEVLTIPPIDRFDGSVSGRCGSSLM